MLKTLITTSITGFLAISLLACGDDGNDDGDPQVDAAVTAPPFGSAAEVTEAETLYTTISGESYDEEMNGWGFFPMADGLTSSDPPHASQVDGFVQIFANEEFLGSADKSDPAVGSIIVKHNLSAQDATAIASITLMLKKEAGYDDEAKDWFWAKYQADGTIDTNGDGVSLAGRIGALDGGGCKGCHSQDPTDFIVSDPEAQTQP